MARAARSRAAGGPAAGLLDALNEAAVSELVMGGALPTPPSQAITTGTRTLDLRAEAAAEVRRLETTRAYVARSPPRGVERAAVLSSRHRLRRSTLTAGLVAVFSLSLADADGRRVHSEVVTLQLDRVPPRLPGQRATDMRSIVTAVQGSSVDPRHALGAWIAERLAAIATQVEATRTAAGREAAQRDEARLRTEPSAAMQMVQAGLFDRRALAAQARASAARRALLEGIDTRRQTGARTTALQPGVDLVAVLELSRRRR
jgi:hypothetical protein